MATFEKSKDKNRAIKVGIGVGIGASALAVGGVLLLKNRKVPTKIPEDIPFVLAKRQHMGELNPLQIKEITIKPHTRYVNGKLIQVQQMRRKQLTRQPLLLIAGKERQHNLVGKVADTYTVGEAPKLSTLTKSSKLFTQLPGTAFTHKEAFLLSDTLPKSRKKDLAELLTKLDKYLPFYGARQQVSIERVADNDTFAAGLVQAKNQFQLGNRIVGDTSQAKPLQVFLSDSVLKNRVSTQDAFLHEYGHYLDGQIGGNKFASEIPGHWANRVVDSVRNTKTVSNMSAEAKQVARAENNQELFTQVMGQYMSDKLGLRQVSESLKNDPRSVFFYPLGNQQAEWNQIKKQIDRGLSSERRKQFIRTPPKDIQEDLYRAANTRGKERQLAVQSVKRKTDKLKKKALYMAGDIQLAHFKDYAN